MALNDRITQLGIDSDWILTALGENVMISDRDHNLIWMSAPAQELFRQMRSETGKTPEMMLDNSIAPYHQNFARVADILNNKNKMPHTGHVQIGNYHARLTATPVTSDSGEHLANVVVWRDLTEQKKLEAEKEQAYETSRRMVEDMSEIPQKIAHLIKDITEVSKQTKMVALNASIEAARAGEQGRGFEIVASEVRKLSDRSAITASKVQESIDEVNALVQSILRLGESE